LDFPGPSRYLPRTTNHPQVTVRYGNNGEEVGLKLKNNKNNNTYIPIYLKVKVTKLNEFWEFILLDHFNLL
jgi:hypothetical protein